MKGSSRLRWRRGLGGLALLCALALASGSGCASKGHGAVRRLARIGMSGTEYFIQSHFLYSDLSAQADRITVNPRTGITYAGYVVVSAQRHEKSLYAISPDGAVSLAARLGSCQGYSTAVAFNPREDRVYATCGNGIVRIERSGRQSDFAGADEKGHRDGTRTIARFDMPFDLDFDSRGNLYVADYPAIRRISPGGIVTTIAGKCRPKYGKFPGCHGGDKDGRGPAAQFTLPIALAVAGLTGYTYAVDEMNENVRAIAPDGNVRTAAGGCPLVHTQALCPHGFGFRDGRGRFALFNEPFGIAYDPDNGALYIADRQNDAIRRMTADGWVTTLSRGVERPRGVAYNPVTRKLEVTDGLFLWTIDPH